MTSTHTPFPAEDHDLLMSVKELKTWVEDTARAKSESASLAMSKAEEQRQKLIEQLKSTDPIDEKRIKAFLVRLKDAASKGEKEVMVARFPNELCTDHGRAINQAEEGWPETLIGQPRVAYEIWKEHLQPLGYHMKALIVDWPHGLPGDIGLYVSWES
ncbi:hypothetical protein [Paracoccus lutimaris]|uniref:Uncharacterized protein n=1 Tax=Paracoccus lutimaris TaxID=1490030 RepID=A0A368Z7I3_9RHOB|nr:hypothetical protein [Paracoccus lutimaris]RCW87117.1 hypothetical protein DFP89_103121 [Paracoccus lutimaris]